ncbi:helix-turn-helix domain-containing protein [Sporosarcina limicola]|uniref:Transposase n=1 Tax=Sporosarcina limicola TaxID=34101 RepID=A0A927MEV8_9BACL|nr:winged helix-turn-helix domain-containing protein [Sporosarcina limicola]MBE1553295.1 putative transposase [Sporosarcina limicola]
MTHEVKVAELRKAMKNVKDRRHFERYEAVYLSMIGYTQKEIAKVIGRTRKTVHTSISTYRKAGIIGLNMGYSPGKASRLSTEKMEQLKDTVSNYLPSDVGFPAHYNWTLALVVPYIQREWGKSYSLKGASLLLHKLGLSYTRPTYTLKKADPVKQEEFIETTFLALKKLLNEEIERILLKMSP